MKWPSFPRWRWWAVGIGWGVPLLLIGVLQLFPQLVVPPQEGVRWQPLQPGELAVRYEQAEQALTAGVLDQAQLQLEKLREESPLNPLILAQLSTLYRRQGKLADATASLKLALEHDPGLKEGWYNLACLQQLQGWRADALESLRMAIRVGLDVRKSLPTDPDLKELLDEPHVQLYLQGASTIPTHDRSLWVSVEPSVVNPGQEVQVKLELLGLAAEGQATPPSGASVRWEGRRQLPQLEPLNLTAQRSVGQVGTRGWSRWTLEARLRAREAGSVRLGPWLGEVEAFQVSAPAQSLWVALGMQNNGDITNTSDENVEKKDEASIEWRPHAFFLFDALSPPAPERWQLLQSGDVLTSESLEVVAGPLQQGDEPVRVKATGGTLSTAGISRTLRFEDGSTWWVEERAVLSAPTAGSWTVQVEEGGSVRTLASPKP